MLVGKYVKSPSSVINLFTKSWRTELTRAFSARGSALHFAAAQDSPEELLRKVCAAPPTELLALLRSCGGIEERPCADEYGQEDEYQLIGSASWIAQETEVEVTFRRLPPELLVIGHRGPRMECVYFVMEHGSAARRVGIYWPAYEEVEWVADSLGALLHALSKGELATDEQIQAMRYSEKTLALNLRRHREHERESQATQRRLVSPSRPEDWRAHILRAFGGRKAPRFYAPLKNPRAVLERICRRPPEVLLDLLDATNGLFDKECHVKLLLGAKEMVRETAAAREASPLLAGLLVIGGVDGTLLLMREGARANKVGMYDPIPDEIEWKCDRLSALLNQWGQGTLSW